MYELEYCEEPPSGDFRFRSEGDVVSLNSWTQLCVTSVADEVLELAKFIIIRKIIIPVREYLLYRDSLEFN